MGFVLLVPVLSWILFQSTLDRAFMLVESNDSQSAAAALDAAHTENPDQFNANNLHYLRGRIAEQQADWKRSYEEFAEIPSDNPLYPLATWHGLRASVHLGNNAEAERLLQQLPRNFFPELKLQIASESSRDLALKIYQDLASREARLERAKLLDDKDAFWSLVNEVQTDQPALQAARRLVDSASTPDQRFQLADIFMGAREFEPAMALYEKLTEDPESAARARFQIARIYFLREDYRAAIDQYQGLVTDFSGTDWAHDSDYQIAACYWRLGEYRDAEKAYLAYLDKYGARANQEGAVRNLVDVYRILGEPTKAVTWLDRMLARRISVPTRQVYLFTKAKILYTQKRYTAALTIFQQLGRMKLRAAAGGTTVAELQYLQALCLAKLGNKARAEALWNRLAQDPLSYYGQRAAEKLKGQKAGPPGNASAGQDTCPDDRTLQEAKAIVEPLRHPLRSEVDPASGAFSELLFLRQWDEAFLWMDRYENRPDASMSAALAYLAGRFNRAISYSSRMPRNDSNTLGFRYPAGYREIICREAARYNVNPLWLHAIIWQESKYNPMATSGAAARGLMQFIPETARMAANAIGLPEASVEDLYNPQVIIPMGAWYWSSLLEKAKYPEMALAAYNGGFDNMMRWKNKTPDSADDLDLFVADIGFVETKTYVMAVFAARAAYGHLN